MTHPVLGIDHVFLLVKDLDASAETYRRLGFTLSPRGTHSPEMGSANYTFVFEDDYAELLGMIADTPQSRQKTELIERDGEGLRAIACRINDARAAKPALEALGLKTGEVRDFSRPLPLPGGGTGTAAFSTCPFDPAEAPTGIVFMCQHKTRDMVWRPELKGHANGARGLAGVSMVSADPKAAAAGYARLYAAGEVTAEDEDSFRVSTGARSAPIHCLSPAAAATRWSAAAVAQTPSTGYAALSIRVGDLAPVREVLAKAGIPAQEAPGRIWLAPDQACGSILEFVTP